MWWHSVERSFDAGSTLRAEARLGTLGFGTSMPPARAPTWHAGLDDVLE
jgi:hypothetical protein